MDREDTQAWMGTPEVIQYAYDMVDNLTMVSDPSSTLSFTYDNLDRVKSVDNAGTPGAPHVVLAYTYDGAGHVLTTTDTLNGATGATTTYAYDARDLLTRV